MLALGKDGKPIGNALTWMDKRASSEAAELARRLGGDYIYRNTGWRANASLDAAKIMYMKRSGNYRGAALYISTLEYMNLFLTGNTVCDPTNAAIRQIFNVHSGKYDDRIIEAVGVARNELPEVMPSGSLIGRITEPVSKVTGLVPGTPVYNGAHDQYCASIGAASVENGDLLLSAGTTWVIMGISDKPMISDAWFAFAAHPVGGLYGAIISLVGSGSSLQWFKDNFTELGFDEISREAASRGDKTHGLFFYPHLSGISHPKSGSVVRGAFTGIALEHDKYDFAMAIMEASAFNVRHALEDFAKEGFDLKTLRVMGGAAKSDFWCGLIAASIGRPVEITNENEACALGAAIIAATGAKAYPDLKGAVRAMAAKTRMVSPDENMIGKMADKYLHYQRMWECIMRYYE